MNLLAIFSATASFLVFRDLPWTAVEKIHALATNEARHRKRRITPECCTFVKTADNVAVSLYSGSRRGANGRKAIAVKMMVYRVGEVKLVITPPRTGRG